MTAMGTPTAQATTQLGRLFLEFSKEGARAYDIFVEVTGKTLKQFIAEGNSLQDGLNVMEKVAKKANVEINNLFNSAEAGNAALALTGKGAIRFSEDLDAMAQSAGATEKAYEKMSGTLSFVLDGIKAKIAVFKINIAEKYFPEIQDAIMKVDESFDRLEENGSLDRLAQSIGGMVATIVLKFDDWLNNIDKVIDGINNLAYFIDNNLGTAITVVKRLTIAFMAFKTAMAISKTMEAVAGAIGLVTKAQWALNAAQYANPIGFIITSIGLLIIWLIKLAGGFDNLKEKGELAILFIHLAFLALVKVIVWGVDKIIAVLDKLLGWIPGIGKVFNAAADMSSKALSKIDDSINNTLRTIDRLNNTTIAPKVVHTEIDPQWYVDDAGVSPGMLQRGGRSKTDSPEVPIIAPPPTSTVSSGGSIGAGKNKTIQDRIRAIEDRYSPDIDLYESRAKLAEKTDDLPGVRRNKNLIVDYLRKQASDLLGLEKTTSKEDAKVVETARNKILLKIEDILGEINEGVNRIIGDFNIPSELKALTEYQYKLDRSDNRLFKRMVYSPNVEMYLTIEDTEGKGIARVRQEIEGFTNAIFSDKDNLVTKFMQDVTRN